MERVRSYVSRAKKASSNRFAEYAYKPKKEAPFGLQTYTSSVLGEILQADSSLKESVTGLMAQAKASSTMENYERVTKKFADFCVEKGYTYPIIRRRRFCILSYKLIRTGPLWQPFARSTRL